MHRWVPVLKDKLSPLVYFSNNWISRTGVFLVTAAGITWLFLLPAYFGGHAAGAYIGILLFLLIPMAFFAGLGLIPLGILVKRRRTGGVTSPPGADLRKMASFVAIVTVANIMIGSNLSYRAVEHMEGVEFCGATCHVMKPEFTAYKISAHSRVPCVDCHVGPGASGFVQSKLAGVHQLIGVTFNSFERPIPTPVRNLPSARETCGKCHGRDGDNNSRLRVFPHFDDRGAETRSALLMRIGSIHGAHRKVRFRAADTQRQVIPWMESSRTFRDTKFTGAIEGLEAREMDCLDCHNRPSHTFEVPERALDAALAARRIRADLPGIRPRALEAMKKRYGSTAEAEAAIPAALDKAYGQAVSAEVLAIWRRNVFPEMKVEWGTYPNNIGHNDYPGCFRCHDDSHKDPAGKALGQDCNSCHQLLAMEEKSPKILSDLGVE